MMTESQSRSYWTPPVPTPPRLSDEARASYMEMVKFKIDRLTLSYTWLIRRLAEEGMMTDKYELSAVLAGTRTGPKSDAILNLSMEIIVDYEERMRSCTEP